jgi:imidazolonepropionase-like amidohydrolase
MMSTSGLMAATVSLLLAGAPAGAAADADTVVESSGATVGVQAPPTPDITAAPGEDLQERRRRGGRRGGQGGPPSEAAPEAAPAPETTSDDADLEREDTYLAITNGTVHTVSGGVRRGVTILCKNGVIVEMGPRVRIPEGAEIVDATGHRVYPGLVAVQSNGIVGGGNPADSTDPFAFNLTLGLAGGITTALTGDNVAKLTFGTLDDHVVATNIWQGLSYDSRNPRGRARLRAALDEGMAYLRKQRAYEIERRTNPDATEPTRPRGQAAQYLPLLTGEARAFMNADDTYQLVQACELAETYGIEFVILGGLEGWTVAERMGRAGMSVILRPRQTRDADENLMRENGSTIQNASILHERGVTVAVTPIGSLFGPGANISLGGLAGRDNLNLPMEAAFAVRGGLSNDEAISSITLDAARVLGVDHRVGSIEIGKDADFAITDGDLLSYQTLVRWTIVNGRIVYDKEKDTLFSHIRPAAEPVEDPTDDYWPRRLDGSP